MKLSTREAVRIFRALSDPTRIEIVRLVAESPRNVSELTSLVGVSQPKVSRHLKILRDAGLLADVRKGKWVWYEPVGLSGSEAGGIVSTLGALLVDSGAKAGEQKEVRETRRVGDAGAETGRTPQKAALTVARRGRSAVAGGRKAGEVRSAGGASRRDEAPKAGETQKAGSGRRRAVSRKKGERARRAEPQTRKEAPRRAAVPGKAEREVPRKKDMEDFLL